VRKNNKVFYSASKKRNKTVLRNNMSTTKNLRSVYFETKKQHKTWQQPQGCPFYSRKLLGPDRISGTSEPYQGRRTIRTGKTQGTVEQQKRSQTTQQNLTGINKDGGKICLTFSLT